MPRHTHHTTLPNARVRPRPRTAPAAAPTGYVDHGDVPDDAVYVPGTLAELLASMAAYEAHDLADTRTYRLWAARVVELQRKVAA
jgi:hypothetical protein